MYKAKKTFTYDDFSRAGVFIHIWSRIKALALGVAKVYLEVQSRKL